MSDSSISRAGELFRQAAGQGRGSLNAGELKVLLPGASEWQTFSAGQSFQVPANSSFKLHRTCSRHMESGPPETPTTTTSPGATRWFCSMALRTASFTLDTVSSSRQAG